MLRITLTETKRGMRSAKTKQFINPLSKSEIERLKRCFFLFFSFFFLIAVRSESVTLSNLALKYRFEKTPGWYSSVKNSSVFPYTPNVTDTTKSFSELRKKKSGLNVNVSGVHPELDKMPPTQLLV